LPEKRGGEWVFFSIERRDIILKRFLNFSTNERAHPMTSVDAFLSSASLMMQSIARGQLRA